MSDIPVGPSVLGRLGWALLAMLAAGCASDESARRAIGEVAGMRAQLEETREIAGANARELAALQARLRALEADVAGAGAALKTESAEVARLRSAVDRLEPPSARSGNAAGTHVAAPAAAVPRAAPPPAKTEAAPPPAAAPSAGIAPGLPSPAPPRSESGRAGLGADQMFAGALASFRAGEHGQAVLEFMDLIARFPHHPLAARAQWWVGEAYAEQRDFRQALSEFQKVTELYPRSPAVPDALLKIGLCYRALGDMPRARAAWRELVREHGTSEAAARARALLAGGGGAAPHAAR